MIVKVGSEDVDLNPSILRVSEATLNEVLTNFAATYAYYGSKHNDANYILLSLEDQYEQAFMRKVKEMKEGGATDKLSESTAKTDAEVVELRDMARKARRTKDQLFTFIRALEKQHDNALSMANNLRQEMYFHGRQHVKEDGGRAAKSLEEIIN